ncbi:hypothetical protein L1049_001206 [Liquidambar formosana]|uniref:Myb-related protein 123 n=1 Tax=Liquidambar formosana TaxID=63359 RepID=A0AAP0NA69_LIQFO
MERTEREVLKPQLKKGLWKPEEDLILKKYVETHGEGNWATVSERSGLMRGGKSCRLRWKNYLRPNIKHGMMSEAEEDLIIRMHKLLGNRWSLIAGRLPGRTDNEVKNYWNTHLNKRCPQGKRKKDDSNTTTSTNKKVRRSPHSRPICSASPKNTAGGSNERKEEGSRVTNPWLEETKSFDHDAEYPLSPANYTTFFYDYEPFIPLLDSFALCEALGCCSGEETSQADCMQPLMAGPTLSVQESHLN